MPFVKPRVRRQLSFDDVVGFLRVVSYSLCLGVFAGMLTGVIVCFAFSLVIRVPPFDMMVWMFDSVLGIFV